MAGVVLGAVLAGGCGGDSNGPNLPNLVGNWNVSKFEFVNIANTSQKQDLVALGATVVVTFTSGGSFSYLATLPGQNPLTASGSYTETVNTVTVTITSQTPAQSTTFSMTLNGTVLTLTGGTATYNFGAGDVPATVNIIATKQ